MTDTTETDQEAEPEAKLAGMRLAEARRERDISVLDIAKELHLDEPKVRALEENRFEVLGAPVFAKGHLRKYAELVGVAVDDILADYYSLNRAVGAPPVVGRPRTSQRDYNIGRWIGIIVILLAVGAAAAAGWWWFEQRAAEPPAASGAVTLAPFVSPPPADKAVGVETGPDASSPESPETGTGDVRDDNVADEISGSPEVGPASAELPDESTVSLPELPSDVPQATLSLSFSGDCWTEVSDANGKRLYFDLGQAGRNISVTGAAPLRALFGDSANVSVAINGQDYVIPDSMRSGRTARLTVNAP